MTSLVGQKLSRYKVLAELGSGGMGVVYRAQDLKLQREVALKVLPAELVAHPERRRRFLQEARAAAALDHPSIGVVHDIDEADGMTFIAMGLIRGDMLADVIARDRSRSGSDQPRQLPTERVLGLAVEIGEGLAVAHEHGIVHRDLKPGNVIVTEDGHAKLIDFGLAKLIEPDVSSGSEIETEEHVATETGAVMGTVTYMSPEQARGEVVDHRSDIFSFGIVLYEMLTGDRPFGGPSRVDVLHAVVHATPRTLVESGVADAPPDLQRILSKCLAKEREARYQGMRDLVIDLRALGRADSASARVHAIDEPQRMSEPRLRGGIASVVTGVVQHVPPVSRAAALIAAGALATVASAYYFLSDRSSAPIEGSVDGSAIESIVALPSTIHGTDEDLFLADAVADSLFSRLIQLPGLDTRRPPSSAELEKLGDDLDKVALAYDVSALVTSSVNVDGQSMLLSVQLVDPEARATIWGEEFEGAAGEYRALADQAAEQLRQVLRPESAPFLATDSTDPEVDLLMQRGLYHHNRYSHFREDSDFERTLALFREVLQRDPKRARAAAEIAQLYDRRIAGGGTETHLRAEVEMWALRAVEIDPKDGKGWDVLGMSERALRSPNHRKMLTYALKAATLSGPDERHSIGWVLGFSSVELGRVALLRNVERLPLDLWGHAWLAFYESQSGRKTEALEAANAGLAIEPGFWGLAWQKASILSDLDRPDEAAAVWEMDNEDWSMSKLVRVKYFTARGDLEMAKEVARVLQAEDLFTDSEEKGYELRRITGMTLLTTLVGRGRLDEALDLMVRMSEEAGVLPQYDWLRLNPELDPVRDDPRFEAVLAKARAKFDWVLEVIDGARARSEFPAYLEPALAELLPKLDWEGS